jgi:carboxyl-terminal processing protease
MKRMKFFNIIVYAVLLLCVSSLYSEAAQDKFTEDDLKRDRLIAHIISKQLPVLHYSDKEFNDNLAMAVFQLYIKQLDYQKRFLLKSDVKQLEAFAPYIDDNMLSGRITLPETGYDILNEKIDVVQNMVEAMLENDGVKSVSEGGVNELQVGVFDMLRKESFQTDPEKLDFAADLAELKDRWRKILKSQIIQQFLELEEDREKAAHAVSATAGAAGRQDDTELWKEAVTKIRKRNSLFFERLHQETLQDHYDRYFNSVTRAFDPHTNYIPPASKEQFDINMRGSLEGIGALLREDDGFIKVIRIIPGSASARQGQLKAEDIILEVAQEGEEPVDITDMRLRDAVRLIRGPKGEAVTLTVKKTDGAKQNIRIIRDVVQLEDAFVRSTVFDWDSKYRIGYVFLPNFYRDFEGTRNGEKARNSTDDTRLEVEKLKKQGIDGLILDLRDDGGGSLIDAVDITGLFIESGPVVQVQNSFEERKSLVDNDPSVIYDGPMVVLVNKFSASASEIVAAALQDYGRAVIVGGKHTHGKGSVQTIIDLNQNIPLLNLHKYKDLGALKVMIQMFYRVNGSSTQYKGVEPDIVLPDLFEHIKSGERYLDFSLPWDSIEPVAFKKWQGKPIDLKTLRRRSSERTAVDEGFIIIEEEARKAAEKSEDTVISVDLEDMREKRRESIEVREKVGAHYRKYREDQKSLMGEDDIPEEDGDDPRTKWLKDVNDDPYVREAVNIVADMINA